MRSGQGSGPCCFYRGCLGSNPGTASSTPRRARERCSHSCYDFCAGHRVPGNEARLLEAAVVEAVVGRQGLAARISVQDDVVDVRKESDSAACTSVEGIVSFQVIEGAREAPRYLREETGRGEALPGSGTWKHPRGRLSTVRMSQQVSRRSRRERGSKNSSRPRGKPGGSSNMAVADDTSSRGTRPREPAVIRARRSAVSGQSSGHRPSCQRGPETDQQGKYEITKLDVLAPICGGERERRKKG